MRQFDRRSGRRSVTRRCSGPFPSASPARSDQSGGLFESLPAPRSAAVAALAAPGFAALAARDRRADQSGRWTAEEPGQTGRRRQRHDSLSAATRHFPDTANPERSKTRSTDSRARAAIRPRVSFLPTIFVSVFQ